MSGRSRIVSIGSGEEPVGGQQEAATAPEEVLSLDEAWEEAEEPKMAPPRRLPWLFPSLAVLLILGWTGFFGWVHQREILAGASPAQWSDWIVAWAVPVLLVVALWLLAMRTSLRETHRFNDAARALSLESAQLEERLATVNRELSLAREFIASQSRDLEALGRVASERISQHADRLAGLISDNGTQVASIASVSSNALENMAKLRNELPVIANSARDVTNQIGNAGRTAQGQLQELVSGFHRLNTFGEASERQVQALRVQVDAALAAFEAQASQLDEIATARFAALGERSSAFRAELDGQEVEALAAIRRRAETLSQELAAAREQFASEETQSLDALRTHLSTLGDHSAKLGEEIRRTESEALAAWQAAVGKLEAQLRNAAAEAERIDAASREAAETSRTAWDAEITRRREQAENWHAEQLAVTEQQLAKLDAAIAERRDAHLAKSRELTEHAHALTARLGELEAQVEQIAAQGGTVREELTSALGELSATLAKSREALAGTDKAIASLTDDSIRLLEIIQAGAQHSVEDLPAAIATAERRLTGLADGVESLGLMINEANEKGRSLSDYVIAAQRDGHAAMNETEHLHAALAARNEEHAARIAQLRAELAALGEESEALATHREQQLRGVLDALSEATRSVVAELEENSADAAAKLAERIGEDSAAAIDRAVRNRTAEAVGQLEQAAAHASGVSREAAVQLRDQLAKVGELTAHLENRVAHARQRAEEQVDNDFARRVALITESLNSNAIDIAKALSNEVTDMAWAAYLRGDRGIFTRRAVRLLDNAESRAVLEIYESDIDFREHVNRFVHDFEAMLRQLLSTRDGHALSVTLLSSDMGKLYVALAQAIERLRE
ncbi:MAG: ATPase [Novosphingobium sp.]|nr:ATPase [Novosphingobium sp.]